MGSEATNAELVLKSTPPRSARGLLLRGRLSSDGEELRSKVVVEVTAPAGFGKTSLLGQWRREALNRGSLVAWLTLDSRDDQERFVRVLAYAMRVASGRPAFEKIGAQLMGKLGAELEALTVWLATVANLGKETALILDEVQSASDATYQAILYLILNAPSNLRIMLASRKPSQLPLTALLARGLYAAVGVEQLRFTRPETASILEARFKTRIDAESAMRLFEKTAGWPLGLQLAIVVIERQDNPGAAIAHMDAATGDLERYFLEELLSGLEPLVADFLTRISILDAVHDDLCKCVTGCDDATAMLIRLRDTLPIFSEGMETEWMRLHPMVREFLLGRLNKRPEDERCALHSRAARWLGDHGLLEAAVDHALQAGDNDFAHALITDCMYSAATKGEQVRVLFWLDRFPMAELERHPRILLGAAWALGLSERYKEAEKLIEKLHVNPSTPADERFECALISAGAAYFADRIDETVGILAPWADHDCSTSPILRAIHANCVAISQLYGGNPEQSRRMIRSGQALLPPGLHAVSGWGVWGIGFSYLWEGQVTLAQETLSGPSHQVDEAIGRRNGISAMLASALAMALWEVGDIDAAEETLLGRLDMLERVSAPEAIDMGYRVVSRVAMLKGHRRRAFDLLDNLFSLGEIKKMPRYCVASLAEQTRMHMLDGRRDSCVASCRRLGAIAPTLDKSTLLGRMLLLRIEQANIYCAIAGADWKTAMTMLESLHEEAGRLRRGRESVEAKLFLAFVRMRCASDWEDMLDDAISLATIYGLQRTLVDLPPAIRDWVQQHRARQGAPVESKPAVVDSTLSRRGKPSGAKVAGLLTAKEEEVLQLLGRNLSNKQIAAALGIGDATVKWHIKNLFDKFNAGSRKHVVDRARMLGFLSDD